jgi:hypothetical protein
MRIDQIYLHKCIKYCDTLGNDVPAKNIKLNDFSEIVQNIESANDKILEAYSNLDKNVAF